MKKYYLLLLIFLPFSNYAQSNAVLDFKPGYASETIYNQSTTNTSDYEILYSGSEQFLESLKNNGQENPTKVKMAFNVETVVKTGKTGKDGVFPLTIEYLKTTDANGKSIIPSGTLLYGSASNSNMPKLDSIVGKDMEENLKNSIFQMVQSTFNQLALPAKKMKIGDSFVQENPLSIPIAGINFNMVITTTYKLKSITAKSAFFEISQIYTLQISDTKFDIGGSGKGAGDLTYDIPNHFASGNNINMEINLELKNTDFGVALKSKGSFNQIVTISKK